MFHALDLDVPATTPRAMWEVLEPYHALTYFAPEARQATDALGLRGGWMGYFASRAAPLGAVSAELVVAVFYHFHPALVHRALPAAWRFATPGDVLDARQRGVDQALRRLLDGRIHSGELAGAAALARTAAEACDLAGRPIFAANAALPWPDDDHLVLWTAATRLREHRADGHVAALQTAGISPCEAQVMIAAGGATTDEQLRRYRWWSKTEWTATVQRLQQRGWFTPDGSLTEDGQAARHAVESTTDRLAAAPWARLGAKGSTRLWRLMRELSGQIVERGGIPVPNPMGLPWPPLTSLAPQTVDAADQSA